MVYEDDKQKKNKRVEAMRAERQSFLDHYRELSEFIQPRRGRFLITDRNKGNKRHNRIINSAGTTALRTCAAGMFSGTMSPARPWFNLETEDTDLMDYQPVRVFLYQVEQLFQRILNSGNFYNQVPVMLTEMVQFGTGCMLHLDDFQDVARFYTQTAGSYMVGQNNRMEIDTLAREFEWTVSQIVSEFGYDACSQMVKQQYDKGNYDQWCPVYHLIAPNSQYDERKFENTYKRYSDCYWEPGNSDKNAYLREGGFDEFPAYCPRWGVTNEDIYGTDCPAMVAMGDIKGLQVQERRKAQGIDKLVNPPLKGPPSVRNVPISSLPGSMNIYDGDSTKEGLTPLYQVNLPIREMREDIQSVEQRINDAFYVKLFLAISEMEGVQPRNQLDLTERNQERLLQLGPVLERLQGEFQNKLMDRLFVQAFKSGIIGGENGIKIPPQLSGKTIKPKYVSALAMAQRQSSTTGIERLMQFSGQAAQLGFSNILDNLNQDEAFTEYSKGVGVPPTIINSADKVQSSREARAQQMQQEQAMAAIQQGAQATKTLSQSDTQGQNALTNVLNNVTKS